jgi:hypothetical protein
LKGGLSVRRFAPTSRRIKGMPLGQGAEGLIGTLLVLESNREGDSTDRDDRAH